MRKLLFALVLILACSIGVMTPQSAMAKSRSKSTASKKKKKRADDSKHVPIIAALKGLKWGMTRAQVLEQLLAEALEDVTRDEKLQDDHNKIDLANRQVRETMKKVQESYTELTSQVDLASSIIGDEYVPNNSESFIRLDDKNAQRYYFFKNDRLYKYVVVYNHNYLKNISFKQFLKGTISKYGDPGELKQQDDDDESPEAKLESAEWKSKDAILIIRNKGALFGTYMMTFAQPRTYSSWKSSKMAYDATHKKSETASAGSRALTQTGEANYTGSVVASLAGKDDIDPAFFQGDLSKSDESISEAAEKKQAEKKKKSKKKKSKRKKRKLDLSKIKGGEGLSIY